MGRNFLKAYRWLEAHPCLVFAAGLAVVGTVNLLRWQKDRQAATHLATADGDPLPAIERMPKVSFLVPAWNEAKHIQACLTSILALRYPNKELVVCAGGEDGSYALAEGVAGPRATVLEQQPGEGKQGALRRCFLQSTGEIIFLTDADCLLDNVTVERTLAPILNDREDVATGYWEPFSKDRSNPFVIYQWANHLRYQGDMGTYVENLDGRNSALTRTALIKAGAFQNEAAIGTDYVLSRKLSAKGYRIRSVLGSRVQTKFPLDTRSYLKQGSRWYRNRLVQGFHYQHWQDVTGSLWAGLSSLFLLIGPLAFIFNHVNIGVIWIIDIIHFSLSQVRLHRFTHLLRNAINLGSTSSTANLKFALLSTLTMINGLHHSLFHKRSQLW